MTVNHSLEFYWQTVCGQSVSAAEENFEFTV